MIFGTEGNDGADELGRNGVSFDGGEMAQIRANLQFSREEKRFVRHCSMLVVW